MAVTDIAPFDHIAPFGESGKWELFFKEPVKELDHPIPPGDADGAFMMGPKYTSHEILLRAKTVTDLMRRPSSSV
jgi:hypothetical protein